MNTEALREEGGSIADIDRIASELLAGASEGEALGPLEAALIELGLAASVTALDLRGINAALDRAQAAGASAAQMLEIVSLVSGLGVHSLMVSVTAIHALVPDDQPLDDERERLWARYVGDDPFWVGFRAELPGFLEAMLRLSPDQFTAFFEYCSVPWRSGTVRAWCKELIAMACDATPAHRFMPGFRLHLRNALALGVGRRAITETLALAVAAPPHRGVG